MARRKPTGQGRAAPSSSVVGEEKEWRVWFEQVEARKKKLQDVRKQPFVVCESEKDGKPLRIARRKSQPLHIAAVLKKEKKRDGRHPDSDIAEIQALWERIADSEIALESSVYSFRKGVLTISLFNSSLHQEIRQFHHESILNTMRDAWTVRTPLLKIRYRLDNR